MLVRRSDENKILSFRNRQYSVILWVEPAGITTAGFVHHVVEGLQLPLRIGSLPILKSESIAKGFEHAQ